MATRSSTTLQLSICCSSRLDNVRANLQHGTFTTLGNPGSNDHVYGYAMNNAGDVVGFANNPVDRHMHGFVYHARSMTNLNDVVNNLNGWRISIGYRINDYGEIVAWVHNDTTEQWQLAVPLPILD